ncbi:MAG TPA: hypothetical protein VIK82_08455 [Porticoccaceae bacterium]
MTPQVHRTLLITTAYRDAALQLIVAAAGEGQAGMLQTPVQTAATYDEEGNELTPSILSHYMSTGLIDEPFADILPLDEWDGKQYVRTREPDYEAIIAVSGGTVTLEQLEPILAAAVITDEDWRVTLGNLQLVITGETE